MSQTHKYKNTQIHKYTNKQIHKYSTSRSARKIQHVLYFWKEDFSRISSESRPVVQGLVLYIISSDRSSYSDSVLLLVRGGNFVRFWAFLHHTSLLAHFVKSFRAYNVKSSSTLFSGNILSNFKTYFPNARFFIQLGYNLITISWNYQEWDFSDPSIIKPRKHSFKCDVLLWKTLIRVSIEF